jgi:hypothetical protein
VLGILAGTLEFATKQVDTELFDEAAFFKTRSGLWVDSDLKRLVGLQTRSTRPDSDLKPRLLSQEESEVIMFGLPGTEKWTETLEKAADLGQIAGKLAAQPNGEEGELLVNGYANIFFVVGLDGTLRAVYVLWHAGNRKWYVRCIPLNSTYVWQAGHQVFSN